MIDTYIYGTPKGFDFYEADAQLTGYFRSFYVSTRRDRRLMVNRRADGKTIYSFLCYNTCEASEANEAGRMHGFFGCSIVVDGYQYCADLSELFSWFEMLFNRLLSNEKLLFVNVAGIVQYKCRRFSEQAEEVEWLKTQLPKIFTSTASNALRLSQYDSSFVDEDAVRTVCCNINTPKPKILSYLKKYKWFAISPSFEESQELNIYELRENLNSFTKQIARLSIEPSLERRESVLRHIYTSCDSSTRAINDCIPTLIDYDDIQVYTVLKDEFAELMTIVRSQLEDIARQKAPRPNPQPSPQPYPDPTPNPAPVPEPNPTPNPYPNPNPRPVVPDPEPQPNIDPYLPRDMRFCQKCRQQKDKHYFSKNPQICDSCLQAETSIFTRLFERLNAKSLFFMAAAIAFLIGAVLWLFRPEPTPSFQQGDFNQYLYAHQYDSAWDCSREFPDKFTSMRRQIENAMKKDIDSILMVDAMNVDNERSIVEYFSRHKCVDSIRIISKDKVLNDAKAIVKIKKALKQKGSIELYVLELARNTSYTNYWQEKVVKQNNFNTSLASDNYAVAWRIANDDIADLKDDRIGLIKRSILNKLDTLLTTEALNSRSSVRADIDKFFLANSSIVDSLGIDKSTYIEYADAVDSFKQYKDQEHLRLIPDKYQHSWSSHLIVTEEEPLISIEQKDENDSFIVRNEYNRTQTIEVPEGWTCIVKSNVKMTIDDSPSRSGTLKNVGNNRLIKTKSGVQQIIRAGDITITVKCKSNEIEQL